MAAAAPVAMGLQAVGGAASTYANVQAHDMNAKSLSNEADSVRMAAQFDEQQTRRKNSLLMGTANAQAAASGIDVTSGSSLFLELDRVKQSEIEAQNIRRTGQMQYNQLKYASRMERRKIPFDIIGGVANTFGGGKDSADTSILAMLAK